MCGISGLFSIDQIDEKVLSDFANHLSHRGPDGKGTYIRNDRRVALFHNRLKIIGTSAGSSQPLKTKSGNYVIVFNGEIYNYEELWRTTLKKYAADYENSDSWAFALMWEEFGKKSLLHLKGMFAAAILDVSQDKLILLRDPLGIKPIVFTESANGLMFASESNALEKYVDSTKSESARKYYNCTGNIIAPMTAFKKIRMVKPGQLVMYDLKLHNTKIEQYFDLEDFIFNREIFHHEYDEAVKNIRVSLNESLNRHIRADCKWAVLLSGGIDSASLVSIYSKIVHTKINTISLVFPETKADESKNIQEIVKRFKTNHTSISLSRTDLKRLLLEFTDLSGQYSVDGFNVWLVTRAAKNLGFKVVISGIGGDEIFQGYRLTFKYLPKLIRSTSRLFINKICQIIEKTLCDFSYENTKLYRLSKIISSKTLLFKYLYVRYNIYSYEDFFLGRESKYEKRKVDINRLLSYYEISYYMQPQLLIDADYFSMLNGVELRTPFIDYDLFNSVFSASPNLFQKRGLKGLLIDAVGDLPTRITKSKKKGFVVPVKYEKKYF